LIFGGPYATLCGDPFSTVVRFGLWPRGIPFKTPREFMAIEPNTEEERLALGRWIRKGQELIIATSPLGESYLDPNVKRDPEVQSLSEEYVKFDHQMAEQLPHLKGRFRWDLEKYFRDHYGPYLPKE